MKLPLSLRGRWDVVNGLEDENEDERDTGRGKRKSSRRSWPFVLERD